MQLDSEVISDMIIDRDRSDTRPAVTISRRAYRVRGASPLYDLDSYHVNV